MERPEDRYRLNDGAKEVRLRKMRARLDAATPQGKTRGSVRRIMWFVILAAMAWVIWFRPH